MTDYIKREDAIEQFDYYDLSEYLTTQIRWMLMDVPSADVAPIRHGRWKSGACSKCGGIKPMTKIEDCGLPIGEALYKLNYCPNCGARMDGEDDEID